MHHTLRVTGRPASVLLLGLLVSLAVGVGPSSAQRGDPSGGGQTPGSTGCQAGESCGGVTWVDEHTGVVGGDSLAGCIVRVVGQQEAGEVQSDSYRPVCPPGYMPDPDWVPPPPTHAEVLATCPSPPTPGLGHDPTVEQFITGLETRFWAVAADPAPVVSSIRGYPTRCVVAATSFTFDAGDPHAEVFGQEPVHTTTTRGGPHPDEAFAYTYERVGIAAVGLQVTWTASTSTGGTALGQTTRTTSTGKAVPIREVVTTATTPSG